MTAQILEISGPGIQGPPGSTWRTAAGTPDNAVGINGDFWLNTNTGAISKRVDGIYTGVGNIAGPPGAAGISSVIRSGSGVPDNAVGNDNDVYLRTTGGTVYQRQSGTYQVVGNMTGPSGTPGTVWRSSTSSPSNGTGVDGDFHLKTTTGEYWQRQSGSYVLLGNFTGPAGSGGSSTAWTTGAGVPSNGSGANGDFYLRTNGDVYQKSGGAWAVVASLAGPTGPAVSIAEVNDIPARDAISGGGLVVGRIVYVKSEGIWYQLASTGPTVWSRIAGQVDSRVWYVPATLMDDSSGTSPGDPTSHIQGWIDAASSAYNSNLGRVKLVFPSGRWQTNEITLKGQVEYSFPGVTIFRRRTAGTSGSNRSIMNTARRTGINVNGTTAAFSSWVTSPLDMSVAANWYGDSDDIAITGPGRLILDPANLACNLAHFRCLEVQRMFIAPGALEIWHGSGSDQRVWATTISAREMHWYSPIIRGGALPWQDGIHFTHGKGINIHGGFIQCGDDALVCGNETAGGSTSGPPEGISDVTAVGVVCDSNLGRAANAFSGSNWISLPTSGTDILTVRRFTAVGLTGHCAKTHAHVLGATAQDDSGSIYRYTITAPGSGYTNGTYKCAVVSGDGNGTGAFCFVTVSGGAITGATMWWDSAAASTGTAAFAKGSGYKVNGTVNLSGISGTPGGGAITANVATLDNTKVSDLIYEFNGQQGSASHDNTEPYTLYLKGCSRVTIRGCIKTTEASSSPQHRPFYIFGCDDVTISMKYDGSFTKGGIVSTGIYLGSVIDNLRFQGCNFSASTDGGAGVIKLLGTLGNIYVDQCIFRDVPNNLMVIRIPDLEGVNTSIRHLELSRNRLIPASGSPSNLYAILFVHNAGGVNGQVTHMEMWGNDWSLVPNWNNQQTWQDSVLNWRIRDNRGFKSKFRKVVTVGAAATSQAFTTGTNLGFPGGAADLNSACLSIVPINLPTNAGVQWAAAVTAVDSATISLSGAPGGSGQKFAVTIDCSARPVDTNAG